MNIKDLLLEGGHVEYPYKQKKNEWLGTAKMYFFEGYFTKPYISVDIYGDSKHFPLSEVDKAVEYFIDNVFTYKNLHYKVNITMAELHEKGDYIDLDDEDDYKRVRELILEKKKKEDERNTF